ncbi:MAG: EamA family transporter [Nitrospirota bacterium]
MQAYLKIVIAMIIWSTWGVMIRWIDLPPTVVLFYTSLFAGCIVPCVLAYRGDFPHDMYSFKCAHLFIFIALASIANNITYFYAFEFTSVSNTVFTHYTAPILVAVLAPILLAEQLERITFVSLFLAMIGMALIVYSSGGLDFSSAHLPGILFGTASGVAYAFVIILTRRLSGLNLHYKAIMLLLWFTVISTSPVIAGTDYDLDEKKIILLLITGFLHSSAAPLLYFNALRFVPAQHAAILGYIEPLAAIPLAYLFLSETPGHIAVLGGLFILVSGYLVIHFRLKSNTQA